MPARLPYLVLLGSILCVLLLGLCAQTRLYYDYAWQLMSVRDYARGDTDSPFVIRSADPADLSRDRTEWTIGYPLAYNAAGTLLVSVGLSPGGAHRAIATISVLLGVLGWYCLLRDCTALSPRARVVVHAAVCLSYNGALMITFMMPEVFLFATVPWQIWLFWQITDPGVDAGRRIRLGLLLGGCSGLAYTFRYIAALHSLPLLALTAVLLWRKRLPRWQAVLGAMSLAAAVPVAVMSAFNYLHTGGVNSVSGSQPWSLMPHWPSLNQWLLCAVGPAPAFLGASFVFNRAADFLNLHWLPVSSYDWLITLQLALAMPTALFVSTLLVRFAPRNRLLLAAVAGWAGTAGGLLWLYSRSSIPQTDPRYFVATAWLLLPLAAMAAREAWTASRPWRVACLLLLSPFVAVLPASLYSATLSLRSAQSADASRVVPGGRLDLVALKSAIRVRLPNAEAEVVWMCFQPGVLYGLDGRHVFESYASTPVDYRSSRPVQLVVLRDRAQTMHPSTYANNYHFLDIMDRTPDLQAGDYDIFIREIGPGGLISRKPNP